MAGEGTPVTTWVPSRKWAVNVVTTLVGIAIMFVTTGAWDVEESVALLTLVGAASTTYLIPNADTT